MALRGCTASCSSSVPASSLSLSWQMSIWVASLPQNSKSQGRIRKNKKHLRKKRPPKNNKTRLQIKLKTQLFGGPGTGGGFGIWPWVGPFSAPTYPSHLFHFSFQRDDVVPLKGIYSPFKGDIKEINKNIKRL